MQSRLPGPRWEESKSAEAQVFGAHTHTLGRSSTAGTHLGPSEAGHWPERGKEGKLLTSESKASATRPSPSEARLDLPRSQRSL